MFDFRGVDWALAELITIPEAPVIASEPAADVFKKLRRVDCAISAPLIVSQFTADPNINKQPGGSFGVSRRPRAESTGAYGEISQATNLPK
jgi:hypothetical protein